MVIVAGIKILNTRFQCLCERQTKELGISLELQPALDTAKP